MKKINLIIIIVIIGLISFVGHKLNNPHYNSCGFTGPQPIYTFEENFMGSKCTFSVKNKCGGSSSVKDECESFSKEEKKTLFNNYLNEKEDIDLITSRLITYKSKNLCDFSLKNSSIKSAINDLHKIIC